MIWKCKSCGQDYGKDDYQRVSGGKDPDPEWPAEDGRCWCCHYNFLFDLYGGLLEPNFEICNTCGKTRCCCPCEKCGKVPDEFFVCDCEHAPPEPLAEGSIPF